MLLKIPDFLTQKECAAVVAMAETGRFVDGLVSLPGGDHETKNNKQLKPTAKQSMRLQSIVNAAMARSQEARAFTQPKQILPPTLSRYRVGGRYVRHLDAPIFAREKNDFRTDQSITVFLKDPATYDGGALVLETEFGDMDVKLPAGGAVIYATHYLHEVQEITRGERLALVTWVHSRIADPMKRQILFDIELSRNELTKVSPRAETTARIARCHATLTKLWSDM